MRAATARPLGIYSHARSAGQAELRGLRDGLQGLWAPVLGHSGNRIPDLSGKAHHGRYDASVWVPTEHGWAVAQALTRAAPNYRIELGSEALVAAGSPGLTALLWINPAWIYGADAYPYFGQMNNETGQGNFILGVNNGQWRFLVKGDAIREINASAGADVNKWSVAVGTWAEKSNGATGPRQTIWKNGNIISGPVTMPDAPLASAGSAVAFAGYLTGWGGGNWDARIAMLAVWSRCLLPAEIVAISADPMILVRERRRHLPSLPGPTFKAAWAHRRQHAIGTGVI